MQKIIILDNDAAEGIWLKAMLMSAGFDAELIENSAQIPDRLARADVDLLLLDINVRHQDGTQNGMDLMCELRAFGHRLPIVLITETLRQRASANYFQADGVQCAARPLQSDYLNILLHELLNKHLPVVAPTRPLGVIGGRMLGCMPC